MSESGDWRSRPNLRVGAGCTVAELGRDETTRFPYQDVAVDKLTDWYQSDDRAGVLCLPTGAGKTRTAVDFVLERVLDRRVRVLWACHRTELVDQAMSTFARRAHLTGRVFRIGRHGRRGPTRNTDLVSVTVASIPSLARSIEEVWKRQGGFQLVVIDECHHGVARSWRRLIEAIEQHQSETKILGLSATPTRRSRRESAQLWALFGDIIHEERVVDLVRDRYLAQPELVAVDSARRFVATPAELRKYERFGELPTSLVTRIAADEARNALAVSTYLEDPGRWGKTLVFAARIEQAHFIRERLRSAGVRARVATGRPADAKERRASLDDFRAGRCDVLVNVSVLTEGTDLPGVETVIIARPTRSLVLFQQMVGRGMRGPKVGGSETCRIVVVQDHIDGLEHGLAHSYAWEAEQLRALGLDAPTEVRARAGATSPDPFRDRASELAAELRRRLADVDSLALTDSTSLLGWWEITADRSGGGHRHVLPRFDGDDELAEEVEAMAGAIRRGEAPAEAPASKWLSYSMVWYYWRRAAQLHRPPLYREIAGLPDGELAAFFDDASAWRRDRELDQERAELERSTREIVKRVEREYLQSLRRYLELRADGVSDVRLSLITLDPRPEHSQLVGAHHVVDAVHAAWTRAWGEPTAPPPRIPAALLVVWTRAFVLVGRRWATDKIQSFQKQYVKRLIADVIDRHNRGDDRLAFSLDVESPGAEPEQASARREVDRALLCLPEDERMRRLKDGRRPAAAAARVPEGRAPAGTLHERDHVDVRTWPLVGSLRTNHRAIRELVGEATALGRDAMRGTRSQAQRLRPRARQLVELAGDHGADTVAVVRRALGSRLTKQTE